MRISDSPICLKWKYLSLLQPAYSGNIVVPDRVNGRTKPLHFLSWILVMIPPLGRTSIWVIAGSLLAMLVTSRHIEFALAANITLQDLDRTRIEITVVTDRQVQLKGPVFTQHVTGNWQINVLGSSVATDFYAVVSGPRGTRTNPHHRGLFGIGESHPVSAFGSGEGSWTFQDGSLTWVRTFRQGASRLIINFDRGPEGLICNATASLARENGTGAIQFKTEDGFDIKVSSVKTLSTTCNVKVPG